jgi:hypothetical protein
LSIFTKKHPTESLEINYRIIFSTVETSITVYRTLCVFAKAASSFFVNVLKREWHTLELISAKREQRLPTVLSLKAAFGSEHRGLFLEK